MAGYGGQVPADMRSLAPSITGSVVTVALVFAGLVALSYPVFAAVLLVAGIAGYAVARTLGHYVRAGGVPVPGAGLRVRISAACGHTAECDEQVARGFTVALVEERRS